MPAQVERLVPCTASPYQKALIDMVMRSASSSCSGDGPAKTKHINNAVMELRTICNHPLLSQLHQPGSEASLADSTVPAILQLCGKMDVLDGLLRKLVFKGHKVGTSSVGLVWQSCRMLKQTLERHRAPTELSMPAAPPLNLAMLLA